MGRSTKSIKEYGHSLLSWYRRNGRDLPWRRRSTPYRVWISEIMLQQTTVATATPYYRRFVRAFPSLSALARAGEADVLAHWSGLGYYHRARNLLAAARQIRERHGGRIPSDLESLRSLPGIGEYTAGAIRSIGHDAPAVALDGNVIRVLSRWGAITTDTTRSSGRRQVEKLAWALMPPEAPSEFNQAIMDLGAMICTPRSPRCDDCPIRTGCGARRAGIIEQVPRRRVRGEPVAVELAAVAVLRDTAEPDAPECLLVERTNGRVNRGLWEIPMATATHPEAIDHVASRLGADIVGKVGSVGHTITRHRMSIHVHLARPSGRGRAKGGLRARRIAEPNRHLATTTDQESRTSRGEPRTTWVPLGHVISRHQAPAVTGAARKIARLLREEACGEGEAS